MAIGTCKICKNEFYTKPSHVKMGWGIFCSRKCKNTGSQERKIIPCFTCGKLLFKTASQIKRSKSGKSFCNKSCQTKWRNTVFSGKNHMGWKGGQTMYRKILQKSNKKTECVLCGKNDMRILAVHHIDQNHSNFTLENLVWLCHNCHYLVHHDKLEKLRFLKVIKT